jgi:hypothetical protein
MDLRVKSFINLNLTARQEAQKKAVNVIHNLIEKGPAHLRQFIQPNPSQATQTQPTQANTNCTQKFTYQPPVFNFMDCTVSSTQVTQVAKKTNQKSKTKLQVELDKYMLEPIKNIDPVAFWRQNKENYPGLFYCFTYIFTMQASSVPSESLFSEAGDQVTDKRNRLDPEKVNKMLVLEDYYKSKKQ